MEKDKDGFKTHMMKDKEGLKLYQGVFDDYTMKVIIKLARQRYIDSIGFPISTGKEADVYLARKGKEIIAMKIYRIETSNFQKMAEYMTGDLRFTGIKGNKRGIVDAWCQKEYRNLQDCTEAGIKSPYPIKADQNILLMSFLGKKDGSPYPALHNTMPKNPSKLIKTLLGYMEKMWKKAGIVHGDFNEFNILMNGETPYVIDVGQSMSTKHSIAKGLLDRDLRSVEKLARKYNVPFNLEEAKKKITS